MAGSQLNIRLPPEHDAEFDHWANELGIERGRLARDIFTEALAARREGRASFTQMATPSIGDLNRGLMEIDRIATVWATHEVDIRKRERDDQRAMTRARAEFIAGMPERIQTSFNPIRNEMTAMAERIDRQPRLDAIDERLREHTEALKANTLAIERWSREPAVHNSYTLWEQEWPGRIIAALLSVVWLLSIASYFALVIILPRSWLAVPSANLLLGGGDQAVCALVNYRMSTNTCRTEIGGAAMTVTVKARPGAPVHRR